MAALSLAVPLEALLRNDSARPSSWLPGRLGGRSVVPEIETWSNKGVLPRGKTDGAEVSTGDT